MSNPYIGNAPTDIPLTTDQLADGIVTTAKLASPIAPTIVGGTIDNAPIGATTANTGKFTTLTATSGISGGTFT
jgi:hypothetical protein|tara:strand:- start:414 stop:635 length:222 start_codon:yes stop_codon:yes gene_type:complete